MANCNNCNKTNCNDCDNNNHYNYYNTNECNSCGENTEEKCTKTIPATCVINDQDLDFLGVKGEDNIDVQTILISIENALNSISNMGCIEYTRTVNPDTGVATYKHSLNFSCIAREVCPICNEEPVE